MKIGIDARPLIGPPTGIGNYLRGLLQAMATRDERDEFVLYAPHPIGLPLPNGRWRTHVRRGIKGTNGALWLQFYGRRFAERDGINLFWGAHFLLPIWLTPRIPAVVTVYDLVPFLFPETMEVRNYLALRTLLRPSLARANRVITISQTAASDLHTRLGVPAEKIAVITPGVASQFAPRDRDEARRRVARTWGLLAPYLLFVGTLEPRKNLTTLLSAFASLSPATRRNWTLVVIGAPGWKNAVIHAAAASLKREGTVRFLGYVPDDELPWLYAGATTLTFPSLYEGFGVPILEAMASGLPVIASDIPVTREVAGDAAVFVPPTDISAWARAMERIIDDAPARADLTVRSLERARRFSFERSAREFLALCEEFDPAIERRVPAPAAARPHRRGV